MEIKLIKTQKDYQKALKQFDEVFHAKKGTKEADQAELLAILIENYEDEHYPIEVPDPIEAIKFRMEQLEINRTELASVLGYKSRVTEVLSGKRKLSLQMIRNLHDRLKIPYEALMTDY
jgi:HTH-type transcriptional regulator/antitoxin HigA